MKNKEEIRKRFFRFLKDENAYKLFIKNFKNRTNHFTRFKSFDELFDYCSENDQRGLIDFAFIWQDTKQGCSFWKILNMKFEELKKNEMT